jgi:DNA-binding MarR family transcriptional regulator
MAANETNEQLLGMLRHAITDLVRREGPDLTARQLATFLICYLEPEAQTVRGLAAKLNISKPAVTRALDRLVQFDLVRRKDDPLDRRSILVQRTQAGLGFLRELRSIVKDAASQARHQPKPLEREGRERARAHS